MEGASFSVNLLASVRLQITGVFGSTLAVHETLLNLGMPIPSFDLQERQLAVLESFQRLCS